MRAFLTEQNYQEALAKGSHNPDLKYKASNHKKTKMQRKNIMYFTPLVCLSVEIKVGKRFLETFS